MSLTSKGKKILEAMTRTYGSREKAEQVFYDKVAKQKLTGVEEINANFGKNRPKREKQNA